MRSLLSMLALACCSAVAQTRHTPLEVKLVDGTGYPVGTVVFRETIGHRLNVDVQVRGVSPGEHAIHIHENPVCDGGVDFRSAGKHLDPDGKQHGTLNPMGHHLGDLPVNVFVGANWRGAVNVTVDGLSLTPGAHGSILGHAVVLHDRPDDFKTDPSGNAGNRIACGVIQAGSPGLK